MITYFFPPMGGSGALRPLKLAKYFPDFGWHPVILTVKNPDWYYADDPGLLDELSGDTTIVRRPMLKAAWIYRLLNPLRTAGLDRIIRRYLLHPDEQIGWVPFACSAALKIVSRHDIKAVYSTSGPMTNHLIAAFVKRRTGLPWVAEFRDEWLEDPAKELPTVRHRYLHFQMEKMVVCRSDRIVTMAPAFTRFLSKHDVPTDKFVTIPAGYDPDDLKPECVIRAGPRPKERFEIVFVGLFYKSFRPNVFLNAVNELIRSGCISREKIRVRFVGANTAADLDVVDEYDIVEFTGFVSRKKALSYLVEADLLLLLLSRDRGAGVIPSKTFEYLASEKAILALVPPEGDVAGIIRETHSGMVADFEDTQQIRRACLAFYNNWERDGALHATTDMAAVRSYDQQVLVGQFSEVLKRAERQADG